jgi:hypothetical protein
LERENERNRREIGIKERKEGEKCCAMMVVVATVANEASQAEDNSDAAMSGISS